MGDTPERGPYVRWGTFQPLITSPDGPFHRSRRPEGDVFFWLGAVWNTTPGQAKTQLLDNKQPVNHKGETFSEPN